MLPASLEVTKCTLDIAEVNPNSETNPEEISHMQMGIISYWADQLIQHCKPQKSSSTYGLAAVPQKHCMLKTYHKLGKNGAFCMPKLQITETLRVFSSLEHLEKNVTIFFLPKSGNPLSTG